MKIIYHHENNIVAEAEAKEHQVLAISLRENGVNLNTRCGCKGACKGCMVQLLKGELTNQNGRASLKPHVGENFRSCQYIPSSERVEIRIPESSLLEVNARIEDGFDIGAFAINRLYRWETLSLPDPQLDGNDSLTEMLQKALSTTGKDLQWSLTTLKKLSGFRRIGLRQVSFLLTEKEGGSAVLDISKVDNRPTPFGVAVDIGTTTVACSLVSMCNGHIEEKETSINRQVEVADDVASRIAASGTPEGLERLRQLIIEETINPLVHDCLKRANAEPDQIYEYALSGNTTMIHLALGLDPTGMGTVPFEPVAKSFAEMSVSSLGLRGNEIAVVHIVPATSSYVGGDIVSDIFVSQIMGKSGPSLLIDIGTNGEMVLWANGQLLGCSTAAGPAFEGHGLCCGMRASTGAIESVRLKQREKVALKTIDRSQPVGICGSGVIDFIAEAFRTGILNSMGRFEKNGSDWRKHIHEIEYMGRKSQAFFLTGSQTMYDQGAVYISEIDIAEILKAKAAIFAGAKCLCDQAGIELSDLESVILSGGFARYINIQNAITIGLLPDVDLHKFQVIGNGSLAGAWLSLVHREAQETFHVIADTPQIIDLNQLEQFSDSYIEAMALPHMDLGLFPTMAGGT